MNETEKLIAEATSPDQIQELLHADREAEPTPTRQPRQKHVEADSQVAPQTFTQIETIGGREFTFEAESEAQLTEMIVNAYRVATAVTETSAEEPKQPTADEAAKAAMDRADLEIQFRRGQLTAADYLEKTGAINDYLESQGVPVEELRQTVEQQRTHAVEKSWGEAVEQFLKSPAGADWPGGDANKEIIGLQLQALGLMDANDKVAALAQAYNVMKQRNTIFDGATGSENTTTETQQATRQSIPVRQQTQRSQRPAAQQQQSSSFWGSSSGTSANDMQDRSTRPTPAQKVIPADARPEEIMAAWKEQLVANGQSPDAEFVNAFRGRK